MKKLFVVFAVVFALSSSAPAANITWVSFHDTDAASADAAGAGLTDAADKGYTDLLSANGHNVSRFLTHEPLTSDDLTQLNSSDVVIISRSVNSGHYDPPTDWNTMVTAPVIGMSGYILRSSRLNLTDGTTMQDISGPIKLAAADPNHPVFSGISLDGNNEMVNDFADVVTENGALQRGLSVNVNNVVGGSLIAAVTQDGSSSAGGPIIAEWAAGATVNNGDVLAGPRMIFLSGSREVSGVTSQTAGFIDLSSDGTQMFLNAVNHIAIPEPSTALLAVLGLAGLTMLRRKR